MDDEFGLERTGVMAVAELGSFRPDARGLLLQPGSRCGARGSCRGYRIDNDCGHEAESLAQPRTRI
jgi:hypothetical protein